MAHLGTRYGQSQRVLKQMPPALSLILVTLVLFAIFLAVRTVLVIRRHGPHLRRIFVEYPIFSPPEAMPLSDAEEVEFRTADQLVLRGSYLRATGGKPAGVIVFCHEFLADRWSGIEYWAFLQNGGLDVFAFDFRNHGSSQTDEHYTPRHWVTEFELRDLLAALEYVRGRPDSRSLPIGLFGISRGGSAALCAAAREHCVRAVVTDGAFPTHGTVRNYMRKWVALYTDNSIIQRLPNWYYGFIRDRVLSRLSKELGCQFPKLERAICRIAPRPVLMIHGGRDSYIRPVIARELFGCAREPREFWLVRGARHNACLETAGDEYRARVLSFFQRHLRTELEEWKDGRVEGWKGGNT